MGKRQTGLLSELEQDVLDSSKPLADLLRKCMILAGRAGSSELLDWATRELQGYPNRDDVPNYRRLPAMIALDGIAGNYKITQQRISPSELPDFTHESITEEVPLTSGVGEIEALAQKAGSDGAKLSLPMAADLARYMNAESDQPYQVINSLYWVLSEVAIKGCLDQIRTTLTGLVAEMQATLPADDATPSAAVADQAVNVVVHGGKRARVNVTSSQASGAAVSTVQSPAVDTGFWTTGRRLGASLVGLATIVAAVVAIAQWQGWNPF